MYMPKGATPIEDSEYMPKGATPIDDESLGSKTLNFITQAGGTVGRAIGYGLSDAINVPVEAANYANQKVAGLFGVKPENVPTPEPFNPQAFPMPGVSPERQQQLDPVARGLATGTELAAPITDAAKLAALGTKEGLKFLQRQLGLAATQKANKFMGDLLQGNNISSVPKVVGDEIRSKFNNAMTDFKGTYNGIKSKAADLGYSPTVTKQFPGISIASNEKSIASNNFENALDKIDLSKHSNDIKESINEFKKNPSFEKAHDLQSDLGREGDKLRGNKDGDNRKLGGELLNLRTNLKNDISSTLKQNGDTDLLNEYNKTGQDYKKIVAPYLSNTTLRNIVLKKGLSEISPKTIGNLLSKNDSATTSIRNDLSDNSKHLLLGAQLKAALKELPKKGIFQRETDAKNLVNEYGNLDNKGLAYLRTPESQAKIESIMGDLKRQKFVKNSASIGIPLLMGAVGAHRYL